MSTPSVCVINFVHEEDGVFVNGTVSKVDGVPSASWTFVQDGGEFTQDVDLDVDEFDALWDVLNEPVFNRHAVQNPEVELDFRTHYIVGIMFNVRGEAGRITYLIPVGERDPVWQQWLQQMETIQRPH